MKFRRLLLVLAAVAATASLPAADLAVYAAASLSDVLQEIAKSYRAAGGGAVSFNFGGSSTLEIQIKQGAPADVFFSADEAKMDDLAKAGFIVAGTRRSLLSNTLVVIVNADRGATVDTPAALAKPSVGRLALAEPETVPAGIYAKEYLQKAGLWNQVSGKVIPTENVRACLAAVATGNVDAGIVYKTDALISKRVKIAVEIPADEGPKISYPVAVVQDARQDEQARRFIAYLTTSEARAAFVRYGFRPTF